jgi:hypothetical protein
MTPTRYPWGFASNLTVTGIRIGLGPGTTTCSIGGVLTTALAVTSTSAICPVDPFALATGDYQVSISNDGGLSFSNALSNVTIYGARVRVRAGVDFTAHGDGGSGCHFVGSDAISGSVGGRNRHGTGWRGHCAVRLVRDIFVLCFCNPVKLSDGVNFGLQPGYAADFRHPTGGATQLSVRESALQKRAVLRQHVGPDKHTSHCLWIRCLSTPPTFYPLRITVRECEVVRKPERFADRFRRRGAHRHGSGRRD